MTQRYTRVIAEIAQCCIGKPCTCTNSYKQPPDDPARTRKERGDPIGRADTERFGKLIRERRIVGN